MERLETNVRDMVYGTDLVIMESGEPGTGSQG